MMERPLKLEEQLEIEKTTYAKAMIGTFHILLMSLGVIGARFKDAGMRDVCIQSEIVTEGSIDLVLKVKLCNRAIRAHKMSFEAMWCLFLKKN